MSLSFSLWWLKGKSNLAIKLNNFLKASEPMCINYITKCILWTLARHSIQNINTQLHSIPKINHFRVTKVFVEQLNFSRLVKWTYFWTINSYNLALLWCWDLGGMLMLGEHCYLSIYYLQFTVTSYYQTTIHDERLMRTSNMIIIYSWIAITHSVYHFVCIKLFDSSRTQHLSLKLNKSIQYRYAFRRMW